MSNSTRELQQCVRYAKWVEEQYFNVYFNPPFYLNIDIREDNSPEHEIIVIEDDGEDHRHAITIEDDVTFITIEDEDSIGDILLNTSEEESSADDSNCELSSPEERSFDELFVQRFVNKARAGKLRGVGVSTSSSDHESYRAVTQVTWSDPETDYTLSCAIKRSRYDV